MKKLALLFVICGVSFFLVKCYDASNKSSETDSFTKGAISIYVDETFMPIIEEQEMVFESQYPEAKIKLVSMPEKEIIKEIAENKTQHFILSRKLSVDESTIFANKKNKGIQTGFAYDALAIIVNKENAKTFISESEIKSSFSSEDKLLNLVFDNANSSAINYLKSKFEVSNVSKTNVSAMKNTQELIQFVSENKNAVGIIGVNWLDFYSNELEKNIQNVKILPIGNSLEKSVLPSQSDIYVKKYPFVRTLYLLNYKGRKGLGMGFASFVAGQVGQRIVLKTGLVPYEMPTREIKVRKKI